MSRAPRVRRVAIVTGTGASGRRTAEKFGFAACASDPEAVLGDPEVDVVFVATRHDTHASLAAAALRAGKAVWLEKPAALDAEQLALLEAAARETGGFLALGTNRRFSPHVAAVRDFFRDRRGPMALHYSVAAGPTPGGTWHTDPAVGGGRVIGEACHFVDTLAQLVGALPSQVFARALGRDPESEDSVVVTLGFPDGSTATLHYLACASPELPKERFEVSAEGRTARCDNFRTTALSGRKPVKTLNQDKGQEAGVRAVLEAVRAGRPSPFRLEEILSATRATFAVHESIRSGGPVDLPG